MPASMSADGHEGPRRVMDQHDLEAALRQRLKPPQHGSLPRRSARDGRSELRLLTAGDSRLIGLGIIGMDDNLHGSYAVMREEGIERPRQHSPAAEPRVLLGKIAAEARSAAGRDDDDGDFRRGRG